VYQQPIRNIDELRECIAAVWEKLSTIDASTQPYASDESVFLLVWKPKGDILNICLNKSGLVVVLHKRHRRLLKHLSKYMTAECCDSLVFLWNTVNFVGFSVIHVSQGCVATYVRCGGMSTERCIANFPLSLSVKEFLKSVKIWQSYCQKFRGLVFLEHGVVIL